MSAETFTTSEENNRKIDDLIKNVPVAMLTTLDPDGQLHSRPMGTLQQEFFDGTVWFFTSRDSEKIHSINTNSHVNLAYAQPNEYHYVSLAGKATLVDDREKWKSCGSPL